MYMTNFATNDEGAEEFIVRVRGLPWSAKEGEIKEFFNGIDIQKIHFTYTREGRPTGEAYIELKSSQDVQLALLKHRDHLKDRYIEVFETKRAEMEYVLKRNAKLDAEASGDTVVRLRGLPFGVTKEDITNFFEGMEIAPDGIVFGTDGTGRLSGEAYVKFLDKETTERALDKHMQNIGHRYIEVFRSTNDELNRAQKRQGGDGAGAGGGGEFFGKPRSLLDISLDDFDGGWGGDNFFGGRMGYGGGGYESEWGAPPRGRGAFRGGRGGRMGAGSSFFDDDYSGGGGYSKYGGGGRGGWGGGGRDRSPVSRSSLGHITGHVVHMRGLPFKATASDIIEFFQPVKVLNVQVCFCERTGRPMGEADVEFNTHEEAEEAMLKNKEHMGERYIELFLNSTPGAKGMKSETGGMSATENYGQTGATDSGDGNGASGYGYGGANNYGATVMSNAATYGNQQYSSLVQYPSVGSYQPYGNAQGF